MITYKTQKIPTSYATCSIGYKTSHDLPTKLDAISHAGFEAIELSMPDIQTYGAQLKGTKEIDEKDYDTLVEVGREIKKLTDHHGLKVLMLQPFANFEGWPQGSPEREDAFTRARGWMRIMEAVGTDMLQIGSSDSPNITSNTDSLASDLAALADEMSPRGLQICYENWCWATHAPTWTDIWTVVHKANRPNLGLCLDTFQSAGGEYADPTHPSGLLPLSASQLQNSWSRTLDALTTTIPPGKIFLLQISDGYRMDPPLENDVKDGQRPRARWSHDFRPLPYDGGYLPVVEFARAVLETGFRGWFSVEVFDGRAREKYGDDLRPYATGAMEAVGRLVREAEEGAQRG